MKQMRALTATAMAVLTMALAVAGCGHNRDDDDDDRAAAFDQVGEVRVFDDHSRAPRRTELPRPAAALAVSKTTAPSSVSVAHAKGASRFDQVGEADMAE